ncbi:MAG: AAA family ATPase [Candidatus Diapherotrites archaeon]|nr:AAA family ATPase [Candidatus Diapherotrites archaeon]
MVVKIVRLRMKNFKSFRKADIPLHEGFTAVAGANASGKSNILDAILFVTGATSLKTLRVSRLAELVNHDAEDGEAKVEIDLKDSEKEWTIARAINGEGNSTYRLDGKKRTLSEVSELLGSMGIDPSGHNVVVQGDITRVIQMNARQRRGMIEEAAGLSEFEEKKEEALAKLATVEQRVREVRLIMSERENYLAQLLRERDLALRFNQLQAELTQCKATLIAEELNRLRTELAGFERRRQELHEKTGRLGNEKDELGKRITETDLKLEETIQQLLQSSQKTFAELGRTVEELKAKKGFLQESLQGKQQEKERKTSKLAMLNQREQNISEKRRQNAEKTELLRASLAKINLEYGPVKDAIDQRTLKSREKLTAIHSEEEKHRELVTALTERREELHRTVAALKVAEKETETNLKRRQELEEEKQRIKTQMQEQTRLTSELAPLKQKNPAQLLETIHSRIEAALHQQSTLAARQESIQSESKALSDAQSGCPVCESPLNAEKKNSLRQKKDLEAGRLSGQLTTIGTQLTQLREEKAGTQAQFDRMNHLTFQLNAYAHLEHALNETEQRLRTIPSSGEPPVLAELRRREKQIQETIRSLQVQAAAIEEKTVQARQDVSLTELNELMTRFNELSAKREEQRNQLTQLESQMESGIGQEERQIEQEKKELSRETEALEGEITRTHSQIQELSGELSEREQAYEKEVLATRGLEEEKQRLSAKLANLEEKQKETEMKINSAEKEINELNLSQSRNEVRVTDLEHEFEPYKGVQLLMPAHPPEMRTRIGTIEKEIQKMGAINMRALEDFSTYEKEVQEVKEKAAKLDEERLAVQEMIDKIDVKKMNIFIECFNKVNEKFRQFYSAFFEGTGNLELSDSVNPLEGGLLILAQYKGDQVKNLDSMSSGEKSLTALAFLFALQSFRPAPFYILDEVDAALDKENSMKVARLVQEISHHSQFISITHNDNVIKFADQLIGVALNKEKSSVIGLRLKGKLPETASPPNNPQDPQKAN